MSEKELPRQQNESSYDKTDLAKNCQQEELGLWNEDDQEKYKSLLVVNESEDANVTLYIYSGWSPVCVFSTISKIVPPKEKYLYRVESSFKFQLVANFNDKQKENNRQKENDKEKDKQKDKRKKKDLLGPLEWTEDKLIRITESLECKEENLADFPNEKRVCLRKMHREKELATGAGMPNLYDILGLDMKEVRKMEQSAANDAIKKAYRMQMRIWHPDKNFGDCQIAVQIILAKNILLDDKRRANYHNTVDYHKGFFSPEHWKVVFWPECYTEEQNKAFWHRICMSVVSGGLVAGGLFLTLCTAGIATPSVTLAFGAACTTGGVGSLNYTISKDSVLDGCKVKKWAQEAGTGFLIGAVTGAVTSLAFAAEEVTAGAAGAVAFRGQVKHACVKQARKIPKKLLKAGSEAATNFARERQDDSVENQHPLEHVKRGIKNLVINVETGTANAHKKLMKGEIPEDFSKCSNEEDELLPGTIKYISKGDWFSKMIVSYYLNGKKCNEEVSGDGTRVHIPADASDIEVKFQVSRPHWGFIMKYDRFRKAWSKPTEPHVFRYDKPPIRTFTISGNLWYEAVMRVSDEYHEETREGTSEQYS